MKIVPRLESFIFKRFQTENKKASATADAFSKLNLKSKIRSF
jgi:hypothetical protein